DEDALDVELEPLALVARPHQQVERRLRGEVEQGGETLAALHPVVRPGGRVVEVVAERLVEVRYSSSVISGFGRVHSADASLAVSHCVPGSCLSLSLSSPAAGASFGIRIGNATWSEYLRTSERSFQPSRNSSSPSFRCRTTVVPRASSVAGPSVYSPRPSLSHFTPASAGVPARRVSTVTRSATTKAE